ncbi:olfactory receptor 52D1-like [Cheilinus undulatus]|uniref:olfactory receptor 52D1-like n=1 Tax=Cheilinus undulatus TaxID=241271 RepID=UPI001BD407FE|nr:olfactory receptor 52D1-like [Cheilinus undulatus]
MMDNSSSMFFLSGLSVTKNYRFIIFCVTFLCYCMILVINSVLIVTIIVYKDLHEPMYILLCTFCINGLYGSSGFYPKFLWDLLSPVHVISYSGCLLQALVMYTSACTDLSILAVMAYDRYLAICRPLEYHSLMSKQRLMKLVCFSVITPFSIISTNIFLTSRLRLCSNYIARLYCVNWIIVALACFPAETLLNNIVAYITIVIYVLHGVVIVWSYIYLIRTCVNSLENRAKFMQTCVPHVTSLLTFLVTILLDIMYIRYGSKDLPQTIQNFIAIEFLVIPPLMNPLIYGFKLTKIQHRILGFCNIKNK